MVNLASFKIFLFVYQLVINLSSFQGLIGLSLIKGNFEVVRVFQIIGDTQRGGGSRQCHQITKEGGRGSQKMSCDIF